MSPQLYLMKSNLIQVLLTFKSYSWCSRNLPWGASANKIPAENIDQHTFIAVNHIIKKCIVIIVNVIYHCYDHCYTTSKLIRAKRNKIRLIRTNDLLRCKFKHYNALLTNNKFEDLNSYQWGYQRGKTCILVYKTETFRRSSLYYQKHIQTGNPTN